MTEKFKAKLEKERERLTKEIGHYQQEDPYLHDRSGETLDDAVSDIEGHDRLKATEAELNKALKEVNKALARIEKGTYGVCENCGQKIPEARLEIMPTAGLCLSCQEKKKRA